MKKIVVNSDKETIICDAEDDILKCTLYETGKNYVGSRREAEDKKAPVKEQFNIPRLIADNKKIRFSQKTDKIMLNFNE